MLLRLRASTTAFPLVVSPASMSTVFPDGDDISIESPLIGPTSRMRIVSSPPDAGGGCVRHQGSTYFQPTNAPAATMTRRTAIAQPQPRVARPNQNPRFNVFRKSCAGPVARRPDSPRAAPQASLNNLRGRTLPERLWLLPLPRSIRER